MKFNLGLKGENKISAVFLKGLRQHENKSIHSHAWFVEHT